MLISFTPVLEETFSKIHSCQILNKFFVRRAKVVWEVDEQRKISFSLKLNVRYINWSSISICLIVWVCIKWRSEEEARRSLVPPFACVSGCACNQTRIFVSINDFQLISKYFELKNSITDWQFGVLSKSSTTSATTSL